MQAPFRGQNMSSCFARLHRPFQPDLLSNYDVGYAVLRNLPDVRMRLFLTGPSTDSDTAQADCVQRFCRVCHIPNSNASVCTGRFRRCSLFKQILTIVSGTLYAVCQHIQNHAVRLRQAGQSPKAYSIRLVQIGSLMASAVH